MCQIGELTSNSREVDLPSVTLDENRCERKNREDVIVSMIWGLGPSIVKLGHCAVRSLVQGRWLTVNQTWSQPLVLSDPWGVGLSYLVEALLDNNNCAIVKMDYMSVLKLKTFNLKERFVKYLLPWQITQQQIGLVYVLNVRLVVPRHLPVLSSTWVVGEMGVWRVT